MKSRIGATISRSKKYQKFLEKEVVPLFEDIGKIQSWGKGGMWDVDGDTDELNTSKGRFLVCGLDYIDQDVATLEHMKCSLKREGYKVKGIIKPSKPLPTDSNVVFIEDKNSFVVVELE